MNKKQAIAYGQITLAEMLQSNYKHELNIENFAIEMRQCFKLYPRDVVQNIADAKIHAERSLKTLKSGDSNGK